MDLTIDYELVISLINLGLFYGGPYTAVRCTFQILGYKNEKITTHEHDY